MAELLLPNSTSVALVDLPEPLQESGSDNIFLPHPLCYICTIFSASVSRGVGNNICTINNLTSLTGRKPDDPNYCFNRYLTGTALAFAGGY